MLQILDVAGADGAEMNVSLDMRSFTDMIDAAGDRYHRYEADC